KAQAQDGAKGEGGKDKAAPGAAAADGKNGAQEEAKETKGTPPGGDAAVGAKPPVPEMVGVDQIMPQLSAAAQMWKVSATAAGIGIDATGSDMAAAKAAVLAKRKTEMQAVV